MKLFSPLSYLRIKHEEKDWYDYKVPVIASVIVTIVYHFHANKISLIETNGLLLQVNGLLQVLIGFYIAALAAVSTFSSSSIDEVMAGVPPTHCRTDAQALCLLPFWLSSSCELYVILHRDDFHSDGEAFPYLAAHILVC